MTFATPARHLLLAALVTLPSAALAGLDLIIDPDRINGEGFFFADDNEGINDTLTFEVDGPVITARGQVHGIAGGDVVTITWEMGFPESASASNLTAAVSQDTQVLIGVDVNFAVGPDYFGQAAPNKCKASAKLRDNGGPPDSPDNAQASLSCDLKSNWSELAPVDPPQAALDAIEAAFSGRKDVQADVKNGKLSIKFKGHAAAS